MKNRKFIIVAFMLVAAVCLSVGYAALSDIFVISGAAEVGITEANRVFDSKVYFSAVTPPTVAAGTTTGTSGVADTASVSSTDADNASFSVNSLALKGQQATFTFTIKNDSEFDANVTITTPASQTTGYFETVMNIPNDGVTVVAGGTVDITVTTKLIQNVTDAVSASTTINLAATTVDPEP